MYGVSVVTVRFDVYMCTFVPCTNTIIRKMLGIGGLREGEHQGLGIYCDITSWPESPKSGSCTTMSRSKRAFIKVHRCWSAGGEGVIEPQMQYVG